MTNELKEQLTKYGVLAVLWFVTIYGLYAWVYEQTDQGKAEYRVARVYDEMNWTPDKGGANTFIHFFDAGDSTITSPIAHDNRGTSLEIKCSSDASGCTRFRTWPINLERRMRISSNKDRCLTVFQSNEIGYLFYEDWVANSPPCDWKKQFGFGGWAPKEMPDKGQRRLPLSALFVDLQQAKQKTEAPQQKKRKQQAARSTSTQSGKLQKKVPSSNSEASAPVPLPRARPRKLKQAQTILPTAQQPKARAWRRNWQHDVYPKLRADQRFVTITNPCNSRYFCTRLIQPWTGDRDTLSCIKRGQRKLITAFIRDAYCGLCSNRRKFPNTRCSRRPITDMRQATRQELRQAFGR